ncbi:SEC10/PgrA surface exclusion domain-containing protein, partial [Streptococcus canis]
LHAESIAGLTITSPSYLGVDLSARSDVTGVHFLQVEDKYLLANSSFDKTKQANPYDSTNLLTAYNQTKETLARAMDAYKVAQTALQKVEQEKVDSDTLLVNLNSQLTEVKRLSAKLPMAESHLITAKANLAQAIARDRKAQAAVKQLSGDVKTKKAALDQAKAELAQQEAALKQAQTALQAEETKLVTLKDKVTKAQESLAQAQVVLETAKTSLKAKETYLLALQEAPKRLENAKA